jgi:hypothetical protein
LPLLSDASLALGSELGLRVVPVNLRVLPAVVCEAFGLVVDELEVFLDELSDMPSKGINSLFAKLFFIPFLAFIVPWSSDSSIFFSSMQYLYFVVPFSTVQYLDAFS